MPTKSVEIARATLVLLTRNKDCCCDNNLLTSGCLQDKLQLIIR